MSQPGSCAIAAGIEVSVTAMLSSSTAMIRVAPVFLEQVL